MSIKLAVLKSGEDIIADVKEIMSEDNCSWISSQEPHCVICGTCIVEEEDDRTGHIKCVLILG